MKSNIHPKDNDPTMSHLGGLLRASKWAKLGELLFLFLVAFAIIKFLLPLAGDHAVKKQAIVWMANIIMLFIVWAGVRLREERIEDLGLSFKFNGWKSTGKIFGLSLITLLLAVAGFILGSIIMANITGIPEGGSDMSSYAYMKNNLPMFLLTLAGVLIVSSFGEEVIYRGFLIRRIEQLTSNTQYSTTIAVIISSVVFGLIHYDWGPMGIVQTGFMGLALGICFIKFKRQLWVVILAHAIMDIALMTQMYIGAGQV